jgi:hypothetical protein
MRTIWSFKGRCGRGCQRDQVIQKPHKVVSACQPMIFLIEPSANVAPR